jgi:nucleotide-binding universal stress UspA family protein
MRVLLGTDGSTAADVGVELVAATSWPPGSTIELVTVVPTGAGVWGGPWPAAALYEGERIERELTANADATLAAAEQRLLGPDRSVVTTRLTGRAASVLIEHAGATKADLVVLGARGHGTVETMLLGSVSAEVTALSPAPVLVARRPSLRRIVLAWDGSECAGHAASLLTDWPIFAGSTVDVISVVELHVPWWSGFAQPGALEYMPEYIDAVDHSRSQHAELARTMATRLKSAGLTAEPGFREGEPAREIIAAARDRDADLILVGTHGRTGLARLVLGSVARNVLQHAPCSVLVARECPPG